MNSILHVLMVLRFTDNGDNGQSTSFLNRRSTDAHRLSIQSEGQEEEDGPFANPLYQTPGFAPTPRHAFGPLQSNPVWSPKEPLSQTRQQTFKQDAAPSSLAGTAAVEEEISFAAILQAAQNNELDAAGVVQAYIAALDGHAAELRYTSPTRNFHTSPFAAE